MTDTPRDIEDEERTTVAIRRAPRFSAFIVVGGLIGFLITLALTSMFPADPAIGFAALLGMFSLIGITVGATIGVVVALVLDRRASRRSQQVIAGKLVVRVDDEPFHTDDNASHSDG